MHPLQKRSAFALAIAVVALLCGLAAARVVSARPEPRVSRPAILVFSRTTGYRHDSIPAAIQAVRADGRLDGYDVVATEDPRLFSDAELHRFRAVVFLLTTGNVLDGTQQAAFERFIRHGGGWLGVHSASDTEYQWAFYGRLVGAYFHRHPAIQTATVHVIDRDNPATRPLPVQWTRTDEWYDFRSNPRGKVHVLATVDERTYTGGQMGTDHPIAWCHEDLGGRALYTAMGHTIASYHEPLFLTHLRGALSYVLGRGPACR
ncbi:MAG: hypothetical protein JWO42_3966 [Chloroflexi bacterium]|nr:hypothetical protein [Chloroflexota bacterium]